MDREPWFERKFAFQLPASHFPLLLERLRGTPARVEERTRGLTRPVLTQRDGRRWSIQENAGHLLDLEPLWLERAHQLFAGAELLAPADLQNRRTHEADHNAGELTGLLAAFRRARLQLLALIATADEATILRAGLHPRLKTPMRLLDLAEFVAEHDDHHLAAISLLRQRQGVRD
jgi:uncharacterized damage-inducible protein DinB